MDKNKEIIRSPHPSNTRFINEATRKLFIMLVTYFYYVSKYTNTIRQHHDE